MSLTEALLVIAAILILIDVFIQTDITTIIAWGIVSFAVARELPFHLLYQVLNGVALFILLSVFHYYVFRKVVQMIINRHVAPDNYVSQTESLVSKEGSVEVIDGVKVLRVEGELWDFKNVTGVDDRAGLFVKIIQFKEGKAEI